MTVENVLLGMQRDISAIQSQLRSMTGNVNYNPLHMGGHKVRTIASGAISVIEPFNLVLPESGIEDDLIIINGGTDGKIILVAPKVAEHTINLLDFRDNPGGNLDLHGNTWSLTDPNFSILLCYYADTEKWTAMNLATVDNLPKVNIIDGEPGQVLGLFEGGFWGNVDQTGGGGGGGVTDRDVLYASDTSASNVDAGEDDLVNFTIDGGTVANDSDSIWWEAWGYFANNGNTKTLRVHWGSLEVIEIVTTAADEHWTIRGRAQRNADDTQSVSVLFVSASSQEIITVHSTEDLSLDVIFRITAEATSTLDTVMSKVVIGKDVVTGASSGVETFLQLTDTPDDYTGHGSKLVVVKADESGVEFVTPPTDEVGAETFLELTDAPDDYTGQANKLVTVKADESGVEFTSPPAAGAPAWPTGQAPNAVATPWGWWKADDIVASHLDFVSTWADASGNGRDLAAGDAPQYIDNFPGKTDLPALYFIDRYLWINQVPASGAGARTLIAVIFAMNNGNTYQHVVHTGTNSSNQAWGLVMRARGWGNHYWTGNVSYYAPDSFPQVVVVKYDGTAEEIWVNGARCGTNIVSLNTGTTGTYVGSRVSPESEQAKFLLGELVLYDAALTNSQLRDVSHHLLNRWGI